MSPINIGFLRSLPENYIEGRQFLRTLQTIDSNGNFEISPEEFATYSLNTWSRQGTRIQNTDLSLVAEKASDSYTALDQNVQGLRRIVENRSLPIENLYRIRYKNMSWEDSIVSRLAIDINSNRILEMAELGYYYRQLAGEHSNELNILH
ncbi:MAG: hypothetical protein JNK65_01530, partial [Deltaproteobacteria bacterium]|nr:hypothetical protein [Deltaproteobacteria bacterium]